LIKAALTVVLLVASMDHLASTSDRETFERAEQLRADLSTHHGPQLLDALMDQAKANTLEVIVTQLLHAEATLEASLV